MDFNVSRGNLNSRVLQAWRKHPKEQCENIHAALRSMTLEVNDHLNNGGSFWMMIFAPTKIMVVRKPSYKKGGWTSRDDFVAISHQSHKDWCFFHIFHIFHMLSSRFRCLFQEASSLAISYSRCEASCGWEPQGELPTSTGEFTGCFWSINRTCAELQGFSYFFKWVGSTTNQLVAVLIQSIFCAVHWYYPPGN